MDNNDNKLDLLTKKIYEEGIEKAQQDAKSILEKAQQDAQNIIDEANAKANAIVEKANKIANNSSTVNMKNAEKICNIT